MFMTSRKYRPPSLPEDSEAAGAGDADLARINLARRGAPIADAI
jgi:hypothetical protein